MRLFFRSSTRPPRSPSLTAATSALVRTIPEPLLDLTIEKLHLSRRHHVVVDDVSQCAGVLFGDVEGLLESHKVADARAEGEGVVGPLDESDALDGFSVRRTADGATAGKLLHSDAVDDVGVLAEPMSSCWVESWGCQPVAITTAPTCISDDSSPWRNATLNAPGLPEILSTSVDVITCT